MGISFLKAATQILHCLSNAPYPVFREAVQAKKVTIAAETIFWGCPVQNFKAKLPFNGMR